MLRWMHPFLSSVFCSTAIQRMNVGQSRFYDMLGGLTAEKPGFAMFQCMSAENPKLYNACNAKNKLLVSDGGNPSVFSA